MQAMIVPSQRKLQIEVITKSIRDDISCANTQPYTRIAGSLRRCEYGVGVQGDRQLERNACGPAALPCSGAFLLVKAGFAFQD